MIELHFLESIPTYNMYTPLYYITNNFNLCNIFFDDFLIFFIGK